MRKKIIYFLIAVGLVACQEKNKPETATNQNTTVKDSVMQMPDMHSFANFNEVRTEHLHLDLKVDFEKQILSGSATCRLNNLAKTSKLILDINQLNVSKVTADGKETTFKIGEEKPFMGQALTIDIQPDTKEVTVFYETSPTAKALQWLTPTQTAGKKFPFLFSQSQAILARSWVPCQDSPSVRITYSANISVPKDLIALMSATNPTEKNAEGKYQFEMKQPIPSYLLALAVGNVQFQKIGERTGVYAEPEMLKKSAYELAEMENMLTAAEKLYGQYQWERYDVIVLPPSFPFGGMENPKITFATPTIIAGDRSLTSLIAHELAHSWSGNLVTNATWNDFWLNEGFTVYFERRIMEAIYGKDFADMESLIAFQELNETLKEMNNGDDTKLKINLLGRDPDDGVSDIAYEKGYFFLKTIENAVGREKFDAFVANYFKTNAFQSFTTEQFLEFYEQNLIAQNPEAEAKIEARKWIYETGLPANAPTIKSVRFEKVDTEIKKWKKGTAPAALQTQQWATQEWLRFLKNLPEKLEQKQMADLDKAFNFTNLGNSEILCQWFIHAARNGYEPAFVNMEKFLVSVGRRKFILPVYKTLLANPDAKVQTLAKTIYQKARPNYHSVAYATLDQLIR